MLTLEPRSRRRVARRARKIQAALATQEAERERLRKDRVKGRPATFTEWMMRLKPHSPESVADMIAERIAAAKKAKGQKGSKKGAKGKKGKK